MTEKKEPSERTWTIKPNTQNKEEADRLRAKKALDTSSTILWVAFALYAVGYMLPSAFGAQLPYYPIGLIVTSVYIISLAAIAVVEAWAARSRVATKRIAAGLALIGIVSVSLVVSPGVLPLEWFAPAFLTFLVAVVAGFILFFAGWRRAHQTLRRMAGEYTAHRGGWVWAGTLPAFEVRNYHYVLAAGMLGAFLLFISSIVTDNFVYAVSGFLFLIIMVYIAGLAKTRADAKSD